MYPYRITVCTPTYNRAYILHQLYDSLRTQTFTNFEWLIIDDGSCDQTEELVARWQKEVNPFPIHYEKKENGGKHRAVNRGLTLAKGEIFFVVDSDDYLVSTALEKMDRWFTEASVDPSITGIAGNRGFTETYTVNPSFSGQFVDAALLEMNSYEENGKRVLSGERALAFYTSFHKKYPFPEYDNEKFMTEAVVYNRMAHDGYKTRFYNDIIWIFEYKEDGLTKAGNQLFLNNPQGYGLWLREKAEFLHWPLREIWKMWYSFTCDLGQRYSVDEIAQYIGAPAFSVRVCRALHQLKNRLRK